MSGLILCSKKSDRPYFIRDAGVNIYSIEELAYYLYNNAYFVDDSFFTYELVDYIESELKLKKIAQRLKFAMGQKMNFAELIMIIVTGSMYYSEQELHLFEKELRAIGSKSMLERMKARAKMLYDNGKMSSAMQVYENILNNKTYKKQNEEFYSEIHQGIARIKCRMFYFMDAIEEFNEAYSLYNSESILKDMIYAKLIYAYIKGEKADFTDENVMNKELVFRCMEDFKSIKEQIELGSEYERLSEIFKYDGKRNLDDYYDNIQSVLDDWKEQYREDIL